MPVLLLLVVALLLATPPRPSRVAAGQRLRAGDYGEHPALEHPRTGRARPRRHLAAAGHALRHRPAGVSRHRAQERAARRPHLWLAAGSEVRQLHLDVRRRRHLLRAGDRRVPVLQPHHASRDICRRRGHARARRGPASAWWPARARLAEHLRQRSRYARPDDSRRPRDPPRQRRLDLSARASRIRTEDLGDIPTRLPPATRPEAACAMSSRPPSRSSRTAAWCLPSRRFHAQERDGSGLVGLHWLHSRGWIQVNASRFSPGDSPTLNSTLPDRSGQFAAGELDLVKRVRVFGGWEAFRQNLDPSAAPAAGLSRSRAATARASSVASAPRSAAVDDHVSAGIWRPHLEVRCRAGRTSRATLASGARTGKRRSAHMNGFVRFAERSNVTSASRVGSYTQRDVSGQFFYRMSNSAQVFGLLTFTHTTDEAGGGSTYWQAGGGAQLQVVRQGLWMRTEGTMSRNADLRHAVVRAARIAQPRVQRLRDARTSLGVDVYLDRATLVNAGGSPGRRDRCVRLVQPCRPVRRTRARLGSLPLGAGTRRRTVKGQVFADWNGNGLQDAGENPVAGVPLRIEAVGATESAKNGEFLFQQRARRPSRCRARPRRAADRLRCARHSAPAGGALGTRHAQVAFGLIPLGSIRGRVVRDLNGNGTADSTEPAIDDAVVVLDGGKRSERSKRGQYAFEAVPSGEHTVTLLAESLPDGALIAGEATQVATLGRERHGGRRPVSSCRSRSAPKSESVSGVRGRPARPGPGRAEMAGSAARCTGRRRAIAPPSPPATPAPQRLRRGHFALQVAAFDDPHPARARWWPTCWTRGCRRIWSSRRRCDPNAPYRVRVGMYASRIDARTRRGDRRRMAGVKPWVTAACRVGSR